MFHLLQPFLFAFELSFWFCLFKICSECPDICLPCRKSLDSPAKLPCGHYVCDTCVKEITVCHVDGCSSDIPEGYSYDPAQDEIKWVSRFSSYWLRPKHLVCCQHIDLWSWMQALFWNPFCCWSVQVLCIVTAQGGGQCSTMHTVK